MPTGSVVGMSASVATPSLSVLAGPTSVPSSVNSTVRLEIPLSGDGGIDCRGQRGQTAFSGSGEQGSLFQRLYAEIRARAGRLGCWRFPENFFVRIRRNLDVPSLAPDFPTTVVNTFGVIIGNMSIFANGNLATSMHGRFHASESHADATLAS